jgi:hypothetical protein
MREGFSPSLYSRRAEMRKIFFLIGVCLGLFLILNLSLSAQLTEKEIEERPQWEKFLAEAAVLKGSQPLPKSLAVSRPFRLRLGKDGLERWAWWKNVTGRPEGYSDEWRREIAAYELDKLLGLNMLAPYVEKRFRGDRGAISLEMEGTLYRDLKAQEISLPSNPGQRDSFYKALFLRRTWENLLHNKDRNEGDMIVTDDWRMILIDHSRAFSSSKDLYHKPKKGSGREPIRCLPTGFVESLADLDYDSIKNVVGDYLTKKEIERLLVRRDKILEEVERLKVKIPDFLY